MRVKNFAGFMKTRRTNESEDGQYGESEMDGYDANSREGDYSAGMYGANPEDEEDVDTEETEDEESDDEEKELTLEDLKAMVDDLTERVKKLEPEEEEEPAEGEEGEEVPAEGEEVAAEPAK
ncbi:hypothetical protein UFOVP1247_343 [uncultured Caudovirales phage]|uniref:Uncharacterized protein n=1 Tax=uncultured Caudovirales phage TaxID=2100421 RepID=A0A6J5RDG6_9CAUD|nr:hypothetical protein UFOVP970_30 [uncultured Caudovirales phage]CAB4193972.1 hypothetical protein UFOVP1247_343 [uncultured Caudovirales phage]